MSSVTRDMIDERAGIAVGKRRKKKKLTPVNKKKKVERRGALTDVRDRMLSPQAIQQITERLVEKMPKFLIPDQWVETEESLIMQRLIQGEQYGAFDATAERAAQDFDWSLRDVYELWHSPDVYF